MEPTSINALARERVVSAINVAVFIHHPGDVGQHHQALGADGGSNGAGDGVGVDV